LQTSFNMSDVAIKVENISKLYQIGDTSSGSLRETLSGLFSSGKKKRTEDFWALDDISFEVKKGEAVGIIGKNGAGKSTLLKVLSRITEPTRGRIEINGRVSSLLEVGTGFHPELTGRENVYLNGTILGMSRAEVKAKFDEIVDFSGVEKFLDTPVKRYSSGMKVRLAFAVAAHLEPEILIIDEVLAVGDAEFQKKCLGKMQDVAGHGRTILFVSHNMAAVRALCNHSIWLKKGKLFLTDETEKVINSYLEGFTTLNSLSQVSNIIKKLPEDRTLKITGVDIRQDEISTNQILNNKPVIVEIDYEVKEDTYGLRIFFDILDEDETILIRSFHDELVEAIPLKKTGSYRAKAEIPAHLLAPRKYTLVIRGAIAHVRTCIHVDGIRIDLVVENNTNVNRAYSSIIRSKLLPKVDWQVVCINEKASI